MRKGLSEFEAGREALRRGDGAVAYEHLRRAGRAAPLDAGVWGLLGEACKMIARLPEAAKAYEEAVRLAPRDVRFLVNLGGVYSESGRVAEAVAAYRRALGVSPTDAVALRGMVTVLVRAGDPAEAIVWARRYAEYPVSPPVVTRSEQASMLGSAQMLVGDVAGAVATLEEGLRAEPGDADLEHTLAMALLQSGDYGRALELLRSRTRVSAVGALGLPGFVKSAWDGTDPAGKTVLVVCEQGVGDAVQFARYLPELAGRGARVGVGCSQAAAALLAGVEGVAWAGPGETPHDVYVLLLDLPRLLGLAEGLPGRGAGVPYLAADAGRVAAIRERLGGGGQSPGKKLVGLCWSGNPGQPVNPRRSFDPNLLAPLVGSAPGVVFVSLQKTLVRGTRVPAGVVDLGSELGDFADTAAAIWAMDTVLTTDTSTAHIAGALGHPDAYVLLHNPGPHWTWAPPPRPPLPALPALSALSALPAVPPSPASVVSGGGWDSTPWYPSLRLVRQARYGDWAELIGRVRHMIWA